MVSYSQQLGPLKEEAFLQQVAVPYVSLGWDLPPGLRGFGSAWLSQGGLFCLYEDAALADLETSWLAA